VPNDGKTKLRITAVSLSFHGIEMAETGQRSIDAFLRAKGGSGNGNGTVSGMGIGNKRPSDEQVPTLSTPSKKKARVDVNMDYEDEDEDDIVSSFADVLPQVMAPVDEDSEEQQQGRRSISPTKQAAPSRPQVSEPCRQASFNCPRCRKQIAGAIIDGFRDAEEELNKLKMEHDDWHLAQDLAREVHGGIGGRTPIRVDDKPRLPSSGGPSAQKKNKKATSKNTGGKTEAGSRKKGDITQFFMKKS
jgi:hypothetical protein